MHHRRFKPTVYTVASHAFVEWLRGDRQAQSSNQIHINALAHKDTITMCLHTRQIHVDTLGSSYLSTILCMAIPLLQYVYVAI